VTTTVVDVVDDASFTAGTERRSVVESNCLYTSLAFVVRLLIAE